MDLAHITTETFQETLKKIKEQAESGEEEKTGDEARKEEQE